MAGLGQRRRGPRAVAHSFPRSAWECLFGRSAAILRVGRRGASGEPVPTRSVGTRRHAEGRTATRPIRPRTPDVRGSRSGCTRSSPGRGGGGPRRGSSGPRRPSRPRRGCRCTRGTPSGDLPIGPTQRTTWVIGPLAAPDVEQVAGPEGLDPLRVAGGRLRDGAGRRAVRPLGDALARTGGGRRC